MSLFERLGRLGLVVVTGKGGVGKSAVTAALGRLLAASGRQVLLLEADPRESLHQLLDVRPSAGEILPVAPRLALQHVEPRRLLDDLVREKLRVDLLADRVLASPVHQHFAEGAPGLKETAVFGRIARLLEGHVPAGARRPEVVILDAPASGHGVQWLAAPQLVADVVHSGPVGRMASDIAALLADGGRSGVLAVTLAEEMPVQETVELIGALRERLGRRPEAVVVNGLYPAVPKGLSAAAGEAELWELRRRVNDRELERLRERWDGPLLELPLLPVDPGPALVVALGAHLERALRRS